jgi:hypothetical protein
MAAATDYISETTRIATVSQRLQDFARMAQESRLSIEAQRAVLTELAGTIETALTDLQSRLATPHRRAEYSCHEHAFFAVLDSVDPDEQESYDDAVAMHEDYHNSLDAEDQS